MNLTQSRVDYQSPPRFPIASDSAACTANGTAASLLRLMKRGWRLTKPFSLFAKSA
jgi:hypothetical protein